MTSARTWAREWTVLLEFLSGFGGTILFHQIALWLLFRLGMAPRAPFNVAPVEPFGVPSVVSLAFWGGVWAILMLPLLERLRGAKYLLAATLFGAIVPTLVAWFIVAPLKGQPIRLSAVGPIVNAAWGLGTALLFRYAARRG